VEAFFVLVLAAVLLAVAAAAWAVVRLLAPLSAPEPGDD
jgi:hypothetical protein